MDYTYDTQLLVEGKNLSDEQIIKYINENIEGDCLLVVGDDELIKNTLPHQHPLESAGILLCTRRSIRRGNRKYGSPSERIARLTL